MSFKDYGVTHLTMMNNKPDIVNIINQYIHLKKIGYSYAGVCPFHNTRTYDAFRVSPDLQRFKCFNCGASGDVIEFIKLYHNTDFTGALKILNMNITVKGKVKKRYPRTTQQNKNSQKAIDETILSEAIYYWKMALKASREAQAYLNRRGITDRALIDSMSIGYAPKKGLLNYMINKGFSKDELLQSGLVRTGDYGLYDYFRDCIVFPVYGSDFKTETVTSRAIDPDAKLRHKHLQGRISTFYNAQNLNTYEYVIVTEGIFDCLSLLQKGFNAVAVFGTGGLKENMARLLINKKVYLCFDKEINNAGSKGIKRAVDILTDSGLPNVWIIELPYLDGMKMDINDLFAKHSFSKEDFAELMTIARAYDNKRQS